MAGLRFNTLLEAEGIDSRDVSVILHTTNLQPLRRMLPWIVAERPDLFDAYQSVHSRTAEMALRKRPLAASFVSMPGKKLVFVGLFRVASVEELPTTEIYRDPRFEEMATQFGATDSAPARAIARADVQLKFDLAPIKALSGMRGRLLIIAPPGRTYVRIAANLDAEVASIAEASVLVEPAPDWREFVLSGVEVRGLPDTWAAKLAEWRGVYLIVDKADGARYVGSAYGVENLLGRWRAHVAGAHGVTKELVVRDTDDFQFSIFERVSPDAGIEDVVALERNWMVRLDTICNGLNS